MPLFLFASGYIYMLFKRNENYGKFLIKKVKRLIIPYITTSVLVIAIKLLTQNTMAVENPVNIWSFVRILWYPEAGYFLWFVWALWWMFCIIHLCNTKQTRLVLFLVSILLHFIPTAFLPETFCIAETFHMLVFFMSGIICVDQKEHIMRLKRIPTSLIIFLFATFEVCLSCGIFKNGTGIGIIISFIGIATVMAVSGKITKFKHIRWLTIVSECSYIIYLFHTTFEGFAKAIIHKVPMFKENEILFAIGATLIIVCGIVCPILLQKYILVKNNCTRFAFGLK